MARTASPHRKAWPDVVALVALAAAACAGEARADGASRQCFLVAEGEPLAARVNEIRISLSALERWGHSQYGGKPAQALERLIDDAVVESEARRQGLAVTSDEIEAGAARRYPSAPQQSGLRLLEADIRGDECTRLLSDRLHAKVTGGPRQAGAAEARAYYDAHPEEFAPKDRVRVRRLMLERRDTGKSDEALAVEAERIWQAVTSGRSRFEDETRPYWRPNAPAEGSWVQRGAMSQTYAPGWDDEVFGREPGEISRPIRTSEGFEIVEVQRHEPSPGPPPFEQVRGRVALAIEQQRRSAWEKARNAMRDRADIQRYTGEDGKLRLLGLAPERAAGHSFPSTASPGLFAANGNRGMTCPSGAPRFVVEPVAVQLHDPHYGALVDAVAPVGTPVSLCEQHQGWAYVSFTHAGRVSAGFLPADALVRGEPTPSAMLAAIESARGDREGAGVWAERYLGAIRRRKAGVAPDEHGAFGGEAAVREALAAAGKENVLRDFDAWLHGRGAFDVALCDGEDLGLLWIARFAPGRGLREAPHATQIARGDIDPDDDPDADQGLLTATNWYLPRAGGTLEPAVGGEPANLRRWPAGYLPPSGKAPPPRTIYRAVAGCAEAGRLMATMPAFAITEPGARANDALRRACARFGEGAKPSAEWTALGTERAVLVALATCAGATRIVVALDEKGKASSVRLASPRHRAPAPQRQLLRSPKGRRPKSRTGPRRRSSKSRAL